MLNRYYVLVDSEACRVHLDLLVQSLSSWLEAGAYLACRSDLQAALEIRKVDHLLVDRRHHACGIGDAYRWLPASWMHVLAGTFLLKVVHLALTSLRELISIECAVLQVNAV